MTNPSAATRRDPHVDHDREAIAAFAAGDATGPTLILAGHLIRDCSECATLAADLRTIAAATRSLPKTATAPRDFRLSASEAARLRGGRWQRIARAFGVAGWSARPFAAAFTTLGIAGLLIAVVPFTSLVGSSGGAAQRDTAAQSSGTPGPTAAPAPTGGPKVVVDASFGTHDGSVEKSPGPGGNPAPPNGAVASGSPAASAVPEYGATSPAPTGTPAVAPIPTPAAPSQFERALPLVLLSLGFIVVGLALFVGGRRPARRR